MDALATIHIPLKSGIRRLVFILHSHCFAVRKKLEDKSLSIRRNTELNGNGYETSSQAPRPISIKALRYSLTSLRGFNRERNVRPSDSPITVSRNPCRPINRQSTTGLIAFPAVIDPNEKPIANSSRL